MEAGGYSETLPLTIQNSMRKKMENDMDTLGPDLGFEGPLIESCGVFCADRTWDASSFGGVWGLFHGFLEGLAHLGVSKVRMPWITFNNPGFRELALVSENCTWRGQAVC